MYNICILGEKCVFRNELLQPYEISLNEKYHKRILDMLNESSGSFIHNDKNTNPIG